MSGKKFFKGEFQDDLPNGKRNFGYYETGMRNFEGEFNDGIGTNVTIYDRNGKSIQYIGSTYPLKFGAYKVDW